MNNKTQLDVAKLIDEQPISRFQVVVYLLCGLVALLDGADTQAIGVAAPVIAQELGLPVPQLGPIFSAALFGAMLGALTFGPLADIFGRKRVLIASTPALLQTFDMLRDRAVPDDNLREMRMQGNAAQGNGDDATAYAHLLAGTLAGQNDSMHGVLRILRHFA